MSKVAEIMKINRMTVKRLLDAWENVIPCKRFESLYRVEGQGAKSKLEPVRDKIPQFNIETPMKIHFTDGIILTNLSYHTNFWQKKRPIKCIGLTGLEQHAKPNKIS
jgi:hypothetical protein